MPSKPSHSLPRCFRPDSSHAISLLLALSLCASAACAQIVGSSSRWQNDQIPAKLNAIHAAQQEHIPDAQLGILWGQLAVDYQDQADFQHAEDAYNRSIQLIKFIPEQKLNYANAIDNLGVLYLLFGQVDPAEICLRKGLALRQELAMPAEIAVSREHLADLDLARRRFKDAEKNASQAYEGLTTQLGKESPDQGSITSTLLSLSYARCQQKRCDEGLKDAQHALSIATTVLGADSIQTGHALMALGFVQWKTGSTADAENSMLHGIKILKAEGPSGDPNLSYAFMMYRDYLRAMHRGSEVKQVEQQMETSGKPCGNCTVSVSALSLR